MAVKKEYKVWMVVEELTVAEDGEEIYVDLDETQLSLGVFDTVEKAVYEMNECVKMYQ